MVQMFAEAKDQGSAVQKSKLFLYGPYTEKYVIKGGTSDFIK